jgi:hypothetical protein
MDSSDYHPPTLPLDDEDPSGITSRESEGRSDSSQKCPSKVAFRIQNEPGEVYSTVFCEAA